MELIGFVVGCVDTDASISGLLEDQLTKVIKPLMVPYDNDQVRKREDYHVVDTAGKTFFILVPEEMCGAFRLIILALGLKILYEYNMQ